MKEKLLVSFLSVLIAAAMLGIILAPILGMREPAKIPPLPGGK